MVQKLFSKACGIDNTLSFLISSVYRTAFSRIVGLENAFALLLSRALVESSIDLLYILLGKSVNDFPIDQLVNFWLVAARHIT